MIKKSLLFILLTLSSPAFALLDYCQDITLPTDFTFADEKFPLCNFEEGLTVVQLGTGNFKRYGFANEQGAVVIAPQFEEAYNFQNGLALIRQNGRYGYINTQGLLIVLPQFLDAWGFNDGMAKVSVNGKIGFLNTQGRMVIAPQFDDSQDWFTAGVIGVYEQHSKAWGMIDKTGRLITPYTYDSIGEAVDGRILVSKKIATTEDSTRYGYLDLNGSVAIAPVFQSAKPFKNGIAEVVQDGKSFTININGIKVNKKPLFD